MVKEYLVHKRVVSRRSVAAVVLNTTPIRCTITSTKKFLIFTLRCLRKPPQIKRTRTVNTKTNQKRSKTIFLISARPSWIYMFGAQGPRRNCRPSNPLPPNLLPPSHTVFRGKRVLNEKKFLSPQIRYLLVYTCKGSLTH